MCFNKIGTQVRVAILKSERKKLTSKLRAALTIQSFKAAGASANMTVRP